MTCSAAANPSSAKFKSAATQNFFSTENANRRRELSPSSRRFLLSLKKKAPLTRERGSSRKSPTSSSKENRHNGELGGGAMQGIPMREKKQLRAERKSPREKSKNYRKSLFFCCVFRQNLFNWFCSSREFFIWFSWLTQINNNLKLYYD